LRRFTILITSLAVLAGSLAAASIGAAASDTPSGQACVGTWQARVTSLGQPPSTARPVLLTLEADGTVVEASQPVVPGPPDAPDKVSFGSPGQGVWQATDTGSCAVTFLFYNADGQGNLANTIKIRIVLIVGSDGNTISSDGSDYVTVTAPDGTMLFSGPGNTAEGTRVVVELPPTPSSSPTP
jgi:hypothetical protein